MMWSAVCLFFFFQAEDGIRDYKVTGVQTCALPISAHATAASPTLILAVDTPSGLPSDGQHAEGPVLRAHRTVTFTAPKVSQLLSRDAEAAGALDVCDIGSPFDLIEEIGQGKLRWAGPDEFAQLPLVRAVRAHKGNVGHVLLIAGSLGKSGAEIGRASCRERV